MERSSDKDSGPTIKASAKPAEKELFQLDRIVIHPDCIMVKIPEASALLKVVQYNVNTDIPHEIIKYGSNVKEYMAEIEIGDSALLENVNAKPLEFKVGDKTMKAVICYATNLVMLIKQSPITDTTLTEDLYDSEFGAGLNVRKHDEFVPQPDGNVVSPALEQQRDAVS